MLSAEWRRQTGEFSVSSKSITFYLHSGSYICVYFGVYLVAFGILKVAFA